MSETRALTPGRILRAAQLLESGDFDDVAGILRDYALALQDVPVQREIAVTAGKRRVTLRLEDQAPALGETGQ